MEKINPEEREVLLKILTEHKSKEEVAKELRIDLNSVKERYESGFEKQLKYLDYVRKVSSIDVYIASTFGKALARDEYYFNLRGSI